MTSKQTIATWFDRGVKENATHLIVMTDGFNQDDYPVYAKSDADCLDQYDRRNNVNMQRVTEVYDLRMDKHAQLQTHRARNLPAPRPTSLSLWPRGAA